MKWRIKKKNTDLLSGEEKERNFNVEKAKVIISICLIVLLIVSIFTGKFEEGMDIIITLIIKLLGL